MRDKERTEELVVVDVNRYKRVKTALKDSEVRYRLLFENMSIGVFRITADEKIVDANPALLNMLGFSSFSELEHWLLEKSNHKFHESWHELCEQIDQQKNTSGFDLTLRKKDNTPLFIRVNARVISESDGKAIFYEGTIEDSSWRKLAEMQRQVSLDAIRASLAEKNVLLKEIHHRVKNNLMSIIGLIQMQGIKAKNETLSALLLELEGRVWAMAMVHENLHKSKNLARVDLQNYLETLVSRVRTALGPERNIHFRVQAGGVEMGLDIAIPCGLILNELITNAFKYAFPGDKPRAGARNCEIAISVNHDDKVFTLTVADNGVGLPAGLDWEQAETLGLRLVKMLSQQIKGIMEIDQACGTTFRLRFARPVRSEGIHIKNIF
jgi:PAS domain S-box-containing protein